MASLRLVLMVPSDLNSPVREYDRSTPFKNLVLANDDTEDWSACDDAKMRRRVQNRLNQRAKRKRKGSDKSDEATGAQAVVRLGRKPIAAATPLKNTTFEIPRSVDQLRGLSPSLESAICRKMFYTAYTSVWPTILPGGGKALMQSCLQDPLLMDATLARLAKVLMARTQHHQENVQLLCETQSRLIPHIREEVAQKRFSDNVLTTMMTISAETAYDPYTAETLNFFKTGFIVKLGALEVHGCLTYETKQYDLYKRLLLERGGIDSFAVPGNREFVLMMDLLHVSRTLSKPNFELPRLYRDVISNKFVASRPPDLEVDAFGTIATGDLKEALLDTKLTCTLFDRFVSKPDATLGAIVSYRNLLLHRLLSLPRDVPANEICRLGMLVVAFGSTYPVPIIQPSRRAAHALVSRLADPACRAGQDDGFLFWACILGMMAVATRRGVSMAEGMYRHYLISLIARLELRTWEEARTLLRRYIWPESICDGGGLTIWIRCTKGPSSALIKE
ncbi:TfdA family Taurine catabolism dioxygenase TauD [Apiospora arundinis]|uniref:Tachykinin family protein n=1 Tax=Apiospora arundinis TaxID=335852 RepID=A0ABR2IRQ9_9PEZI